MVMQNNLAQSSIFVLTFGHFGVGAPFEDMAGSCHIWKELELDAESRGSSD